MTFKRKWSGGSLEICHVWIIFYIMDLLLIFEDGGGRVCSTNWPFFADVRNVWPLSILLLSVIFSELIEILHKSVTCLANTFETSFIKLNKLLQILFPGGFPGGWSNYLQISLKLSLLTVQWSSLQSFRKCGNLWSKTCKIIKVTITIAIDQNWTTLNLNLNFAPRCRWIC